MQKIIFLLPPSEGKKSWGQLWTEKLSYFFEKPKNIVKRAIEKDLKCKGKRFEEAQKWNQICLKNNESYLSPAIARYTGVMYTAIDYTHMPSEAREIFDTHFLICSGMYGLLRPQDLIANYKLPIEAKWLSGYWRENITQTLNDMWNIIVVDLLPESYKKMIDWKKIHATRIQIEFLEEKQGKKKKMTHGVKQVKGVWIKKLCEVGFTEFQKIIEEKVTKYETRLEVFR
jgi:uncharacterized protein